MTNLEEAFARDGFIHVRGAVEPDIVAGCVEVVNAQLRPLDVDFDDPATWTKRVVRIPCPDEPPFAAAGTSPKLWQIYDALLGAEQWVPGQGVGGTIPVRFPSDTDPGNAGWHIDGSYDVDGRWFPAPSPLVSPVMFFSAIHSWCIARLGRTAATLRAS